MPTNNKKIIVIEGVLPNGERFRPSDWAERLAGRLASFRHSRMIYSPLIYPCLSNGNKSLFIDTKLSETNPNFYNYILEFASLNNLKVITRNND